MISSRKFKLLIGREYDAVICHDCHDGWKWGRKLKRRLVEKRLELALGERNGHSDCGKRGSDRGNRGADGGKRAMDWGVFVMLKRGINCNFCGHVRKKFFPLMAAISRREHDNHDKWQRHIPRERIWSLLFLEFIFIYYIYILYINMANFQSY